MLDLTIYRPCLECAHTAFDTSTEHYYHGITNQDIRCCHESTCKHIDGLKPLDLKGGTVDAMHNLSVCVEQLHEVLGTTYDGEDHD